MANLPKLDVVIANNFGHLPMFIGAEKGYFKQHGVDASFKVVDTGTDMVNALHDGLAQVGDMSTTTYLEGRACGQSVPGHRPDHERRDQRSLRYAACDRHQEGQGRQCRQDQRSGRQEGRPREGADLGRIFQDGGAPRRREVRGRHHREHLVAVRPRAGARRRQGRRHRDLGALRDAGAHPSAGFVSK